LINDGGYKKAGFESYALPNDPLIKAISDEKALYNSLGTQTGDVTNFIALGTSGNGNLGEDYYFQNYYEQNKYRECISEGHLPTFRGVKLNEDDKIRRNILQFLKTYYYLNIKNFENKYKIEFKKYFAIELKLLKNFEDDGLVICSDEKIEITEIGVHFTPQIINVFDKFNRILSYEDQQNIIKRQIPRKAV
jgi:oxygen-independent coproporphyrinogen-3 oxidase